MRLAGLCLPIDQDFLISSFVEEMKQTLIWMLQKQKQNQERQNPIVSNHNVSKTSTFHSYFLCMSHGSFLIFRSGLA